MISSADSAQSKRVQPQPEVLRDNVVKQLERMQPEQLAVIHEWFLQLELEQAVHDLGKGLAADEAMGKLSAESIDASIREYRSNHPYGR